MDFKQLQEANASIKTTDIGKGKEYCEVNQRVKAFRILHPEGCISTEMVSLVDGVVIFKATVMDETGRILGTGTAYEKEGSSFINKTSFIENCETSAVGRALAFCGIGIDTSIASKEEVENAKANQGGDSRVEGAKKRAEAIKEENNKKTAEKDSKKLVVAFIKGLSEENQAKVCKLYKVENIDDMTSEMVAHYRTQAEKAGIKIGE